MCEDGSGRVGCGPQEEFRACSDVSIREEDGSADNVASTDIDLTEIDENTIDWSEDLAGPEILLYEGDNGERVAVIVLASLLTAVLLFGAIFVYYYKVRQILAQHSCPLTFPLSCPLPCPPSLPAKFKLKPLKSLSLSLPEKLTVASWPLSSVSLSSRLPSFVRPGKTGEDRPGPRVAPVPPPRTRRGRSRCASPSPPVQAVKVPKSVLDISGPTEVTINGVTVGQSGESVMGQTLGPTPTSRGVICSEGLTTPARTIWAAQPALIISDQPDSSLDIPPPLPDCPPPEDSLVLSLDTHRDTEA